MALKDIIASILNDAEKQAAEIVKQGKTEVEQINQEYQALLLEKSKEYLEKAKRDQARQLDQTVFAEKIKAKNELLEQKKSLIDKVFKKALEELKNLPKEDANKILVRLLKDLPRVDQGKIYPAKGSEDLVATALLKSGLKYEIATPSIPAKGGFKFTSKAVDVDNTYASLLDRSRLELEAKVAQILFETESK